VRLPHLSPTAKGQLWGMAAGGATAFFAAYKLQLGYGVFFVGWAAAWALGEWFIGPRLINKDDVRAIALAIVSGLAFPWLGFALAALLQTLRP
jgi:hypothetical protein